MKYFLIVFWLTSGWPWQADKIDSHQLGPYANVLACESAATQVELVVRASFPVKQVVTVCTPTVENLKK